jgi:hypothetical protein
MCARRCGNVRKWNSFHLLGCAISDGENEIVIITILQKAHQVNVEMRKPSLRDGMGCASRQAWRWILPCWQCKQHLTQLVT